MSSGTGGAHGCCPWAPRWRRNADQLATFEDVAKCCFLTMATVGPTQTAAMRHRLQETGDGAYSLDHRLRLQDTI